MRENGKKKYIYTNWSKRVKNTQKKSSIIVKWHDLTLSNLLWQKVPEKEWQSETDFPHWLSP